MPSLCLILLVKPQYELFRSEVPEGGIINSIKDQEKALDRVIKNFKKYSFETIQVEKSKVLGAKGNQEFFCYMKRKNSDGS